MRRLFARLLAVLAAAAVLVALWAWARVGRVDAERVTNDVWMLTGVGGNVGVLVTGAGVKVMALDYDKVIPGHGPVTDRAGLRRFHEFLTTLWEQTSAVAAKGGAVDEALRTVDLARFHMQGIWFARFLSREFVIRRTFEEAATPPAPGPPP